MVLVGGGAQTVYARTRPATDVDMVGHLEPSDHIRLNNAGFKKEGRHWVHQIGDSYLAVEVPEAVLDGEDTPEKTVAPGGSVLSIISLNDLVVDRVVQATDGTDVTRTELTELAAATKSSINVETVTQRCRKKQQTEGLQEKSVTDVLTLLTG